MFCCMIKLSLPKFFPTESRYINTEKDVRKAMPGGMVPLMPPMPGGGGPPSISPPLMVPTPMQPQQDGGINTNMLQHVPAGQEQQQQPAAAASPVLPEIAQVSPNNIFLFTLFSNKLLVVFIVVRTCIMKFFKKNYAFCAFQSIIIYTTFQSIKVHGFIYTVQDMLSITSEGYH